MARQVPGLGRQQAPAGSSGQAAQSRGGHGQNSPARNSCWRWTLECCSVLGVPGLQSVLLGREARMDTEWNGWRSQGEVQERSREREWMKDDMVEGN